MDTRGFSIPKLEPVSLDVRAIGCSCWAWHVSRTDRHAGYVEFSGVYRHGSAGSGDAKFIAWRLDEFCDLGDPPLWGLVVDLRRLAYEWGDDLSIEPRSLRDSGAPVRVVVSPEHLEAYRHAVRAEELTVSEAEAFRAVRDAARKPGR